MEGEVHHDQWVTRNNHSNWAQISHPGHGPSKAKPSAKKEEPEEDHHDEEGKTVEEKLKMRAEKAIEKKQEE